MTNPETIVCRARVSKDCLTGQPMTVEAEMDFMYEDGTYDGTSIVCDPCYVMLMPFTPSGQGLNSELDAAIKVVSANGSLTP